MKYLKKFESSQSESDLLQKMSEISYILSDEGFSVDAKLEKPHRLNNSVSRIYVNLHSDEIFQEINKARKQRLGNAHQLFSKYAREYENIILEYLNRCNEILVGSDIFEVNIILEGSYFYQLEVGKLIRIGSVGKIIEYLD